MTDHSHQADAHEPALEPEEDKLPYRSLVLVGLVSLVIFFIGSVWATWILYKPTGSLIPGNDGPAPIARGQNEIGIVDHKLFEFETRAANQATAAKKRLGSYGWVDRANNKVHIPIDQAMKQVAEGRR